MQTSQKRLAPLDGTCTTDRHLVSPVTSAETSSGVISGIGTFRQSVEASESHDGGRGGEAWQSSRSSSTFLSRRRGTQCLVCNLEAGALHVFVAVDFRWVTAKVDTETKEAEQIPTISVDCGFFGPPEDTAHNTLPVLI